MSMQPENWKRYEELTPDELAEYRRSAPVAFWPLGLLEHHGWHLPVGFDGLKARAICARIADRTGGVMLPIMWWGGGGGHQDFLWTFYQDEEAARNILLATTEKLFDFGFQAVVVLAGHYPWQRLLTESLPGLAAKYPDRLLLFGTEVSICSELKLGGDHAAREETSYGLALFPELVHLEALHGERGPEESWPGGRVPVTDHRFPESFTDCGHPLFSQVGVDARQATAERGEQAIQQLVENLAARILGHIGGSGSVK